MKKKIKIYPAVLGRFYNIYLLSLERKAWQKLHWYHALVIVMIDYNMFPSVCKHKHYLTLLDVLKRLKIVTRITSFRLASKKNDLPIE